MRAFLPFLLRDTLIVTTATMLWGLDAWARQLAWLGPIATGIGVAAGVGMLVVCFVVHEWGHLIGTQLSGGVAAAPRRLASPFLFFFDTTSSTRRQFLAMSLGGYVATLASAALICAIASWSEVSGRIALSLTGLGLVVTGAVEVPITLRVLRGGPLPTGGIYRRTA